MTDFGWGFQNSLSRTLVKGLTYPRNTEDEVDEPMVDAFDIPDGAEVIEIED